MKSLLLKYVAHKLAKLDERTAQVKKKLSEKEYLQMISEIKLFSLDPVFVTEIEATMRKRLKRKLHKCLFCQPTVGQWIADLTGELTVDEILEACSQVSGVDTEELKVSQIRHGSMNCWTFDYLVDLLEDSTGKELSERGWYHYLTPQSTYQELANFFATV